MKNQKSFIKPRFYSNASLFLCALKILVKKLIVASESQRVFASNNKLNGLLSTYNLRKKLALKKIVKFNNRYFSTPSIPGFPSKAFNNCIKNGGLNFNYAGTPLKKQIDSLFLAITNKCPFNCSHCYEKLNINSPQKISSKEWKNIIKYFQGNGVSIIILTGGDPMFDFNKTLEILRFGNKNLSDFHLHTSGIFVTKEKVIALKQSGLTAAAVGLDHFLQVEHDKIRGSGSFNYAVRALKLFNDAGIMTYVNLCASKELIKNGGLWKYYDLVKNLNVSMIQLLEPRPCGGYLFDSEESILSENDREILKDFTLSTNSYRKYKHYPIVYYVAHIEGKKQLGCHMGGLSHFYIDSAGNVCPCVFLPVSFGNINCESIERVYQKMRISIPNPLKSDCPSLLLHDRIKALHQKGNNLPLSFGLIKAEFDNLFKENKSEGENK